MSTLNVANISDDQSTLTNSANPSDNLNNTTTVDTKYVTNGCAKSWVNFNGTGTVVILDSFGVTSLTDVAVGQYTSNLTNNMATANYASTTGSTRSTSVSATRAASGQHATSSCLLHNRNMNSNTDSDDDQLSLVVLGDLA